MPKSALVFVKLKLVSSDNSIPIEVMPFSQLQVIIIDYALIKAFFWQLFQKAYWHVFSFVYFNETGSHR
uniref:Uncharacterized protein n=1 Tax=Anguilla anguilla TaxID=7936 RepID=A0A0E9S5M2_ANGAN